MNRRLRGNLDFLNFEFTTACRFMIVEDDDDIEMLEFNLGLLSLEDLSDRYGYPQVYIKDACIKHPERSYLIFGKVVKVRIFYETKSHSFVY